MPTEEPRITVGDLKRILSIHSDHEELYFSGLDFYRLKNRGGCIQVEFNQLVYRDSEGCVVVENLE